MKRISLLFLLIFSFASQAQSEKMNFGFENQNEEGSFSEGWFKWGNYELSIDSISHSGKYSGKITSDTIGSSFGSIAYKIPAKYKGRKIKLEGYMRTKDVENGFAGLFLRIDGNGNHLAFDNMQNQNIIGTREWQHYSIELDYPRKAEYIYFGGILSGKGEAWFDDFEVSIDRKKVESLREVNGKLSTPELDKEFDQGSLITFSDLSDNKINDLELLGRIWGFLKYHHPEIAKGKFNWDYELFRFLPIYITTKNDKERDQLLINWIDSIGKIKNVPHVSQQQKMHC